MDLLIPLDPVPKYYVSEDEWMTMSILRAMDVLFPPLFWYSFLSNSKISFHEATKTVVRRSLFCYWQICQRYLYIDQTGMATNEWKARVLSSQANIQGNV